MVERRIITAMGEHLQQHGWNVILVNNGGAVIPVKSMAEAMEVIFSVDYSWVYFARGNARHGVELILGNGQDVISDWGYSPTDDGFDAAMQAFLDEQEAR